METRFRILVLDSRSDNRKSKIQNRKWAGIVRWLLHRQIGQLARADKVIK